MSKLLKKVTMIEPPEKTQLVPNVLVRASALKTVEVFKVAGML